MPRLAVAALLLAAPAAAADPTDLIAGTELQTVFRGREGGTTWFHPRGCTVPGGSQLVTLQSITGSDTFGPVHWMTTADAGRTWTAPAPIPGLGRTPRSDGTELGVCDVVPEFHPPTGTVLAIGHEVFYKGGKFFRDQPARRPVYVVRAADGTWGPPRTLTWDDPRGAYITTCNCAQRITLPGGDVLIPFSFGPTVSAARSVAVFRCGFDGRELVVKEVGTELKGSVGRGLLEPSLAVVGGRYFLTIRAEDEKGYVSASDDGLTWPAPRPWAWDDGEVIPMSTTQQRWLPHSAGPYLVYTRKAAENAHVVRWRAPLYAARVDPATLRLVRATERVVVPMRPDPDPKKVPHLGNFHTQAVTAAESWVTVGEVIPADYRGDTMIARVRWAAPNALAPLP